MSDFILREDAIKECQKCIDSPHMQNKWQQGTARHLWWAIKELPSVQPKQGEWITERVWFILQGTFRIDYQCSECEFKTTYTSKFCPQCGARMKENKPCRRCEDYAGNGMCCAKNYLVYDFSLAKDNCENESN